MGHTTILRLQTAQVTRLAIVIQRIPVVTQVHTEALMAFRQAMGRYLWQTALPQTVL